MGVSGAESLAAAANVFMGQTEAPIVVAPYVPEMTESELMALVTGGMATVSGTRDFVAADPPVWTGNFRVGVTDTSGTIGTVTK